MKAKYKDKNSKCILSIGMIVKNEEKNLRACLEALQPLREAVPSELIIVDTGSEDETVNIAKEYTDKVLFYEWNNDFAAARNYGLDRAIGQWFMFLDADEQLVDPDELIEFFSNPKERKMYNTVDIIIRSFLKKDSSDIYSDFTASRIFSMGFNNRFYGAIHEVPKRILPIKHLLKSRLNHYGYIFETEEQREKKWERNNKPLEEELKKHPNNLRLISLYATSCKPERRRELLEHGRNLAKEVPKDYFFPEIYWRLSREYLRLGENDKIVELAEEYSSLKDQDHVGEIELSYNLAGACFKLNRYPELLSACERYLYLYDRYKDGSLILQDTASSICERASLSIYNSIFPQKATALLNLGGYEEAFETLLKTDLNEWKQNDASFIVTLMKIICESGRYDWFFQADKWIAGFKISEERKKPYITNLVNVYLQKASEVDYDVEPSEISSAFAEFVCAGNSSENIQWEAAVSRLTEGEDSAGIADKYGVIALYTGLRKQKDIFPLLHSIKIEKIQEWNERLVKQAKNLEDLLDKYRKKDETDMLYRHWITDLEIRLIIQQGENAQTQFVHQVIEDMFWYVNRIYNQETLTPDGIRVLPSTHRFAYWAGKALETGRKGNTAQYIKLLGEASHACPELANTIKPLVEEIRNKDEALQARREQEALAGKIKGVIEGMILAGNQKDAQSILSQYELIAPNDPDIPALKAAAFQESPFPEA